MSARVQAENESSVHRGVDYPGGFVPLADFSMTLTAMTLNQCNEGLVDIKRSLKSETVTAVLTDATSVTDSILIGANGSFTVVRQILLGPQKSKSKNTPIFNPRVAVHDWDVAKAIAVGKLHSTHAMALHPNGTFSWIAGMVPFRFLFIEPTNATSGCRACFSPRRPRPGQARNLGF